MSARHTSAAVRHTALPVPPMPPGRPNLVVAGFMGTGKTEAGRAAATQLGMPFVDTDDVAVGRSGASIQEMFASRDENGFRALEREVLRDAARLSGAVIATGGGAALDAHAFASVARDAEVNVLLATPDELARRLANGGGRPLLGAGLTKDIDRLLEERAEIYDDAGEPLETTGRTVDQVAAELADRYRRHGEASVRVVVAGTPTEVIIGDGTLDRLGTLVAQALPHTDRAAIVADPAAGPAIGRAHDTLRDAGLIVHRIDLPSGEAAKTPDIAAEVWQRLLGADLTRDDVVVAVGGGAALDAAGFAAATFHRGVHLVNVPTTLLAMADAAVGGKTALNVGTIKNAVGAFHNPRLVVADPTTLDTLPERDVRTGLAEVVKCGLLASPLVLDALDDGGERRHAWLVEQAVRIKAAYVAADPEDRGIRHALNLGHTFAHAMEAASGFAVTHGEAVAVGLVAAVRLGERLGVTPAGLQTRLEATLRRLALPAEPAPGLDRDAVRRAMLADKKRRRSGPTFVVPTGDGAELVEGIDPDVALEALR